ncbi:MAG: AmmeMemoRadiSam system radical SAM enzyme [Acidobacteria bacterium]|nr:AmmeMemoRadiSam system radical SAM enzyme [Acidobacteriota bacterium]
MSTSANKGDTAEAVLWHPGENGAVACDLCAHRCLILPGRSGVCRVRLNAAGELRTLVRGRLVAAAVDPIEKKPLFHFLPGSFSYSIATSGCNFRCDFCQNWQISQAARLSPGGLDGQIVPPEAVVEETLRQGCASIACTYTEPAIFFETAEDVGLLAKERGLRTIFVTNGYLTREAVQRARAFLDAANVDLKGFDDKRYRHVCGATLRGVLEGLEALKESGVWVEVTTLVVPGLNDSAEELSAIARHVASLDPNIPWHVSRFHPDFKRGNVGATPVATLGRAREAGLEAGLKHVYVGNLPGHRAENTFCPNCATIVIERSGFSVVRNRIANGRCPECSAEIAGVWA